MQLNEFNYSKVWTEPDDFPVVAGNETQARENIQLLHNEVREFLNHTLIPAVNGKAEGKLRDDSQREIYYRLGVDNGLLYLEEVS